MAISTSAGCLAAFRSMDQIEKEFDDIFGRNVWPAFLGDGGSVEEIMPKLDIFEKGNKYVVKA